MHQRGERCVDVYGRLKLRFQMNICSMGYAVCGIRHANANRFFLKEGNACKQHGGISVQMRTQMRQTGSSNQLIGANVSHILHIYMESSLKTKIPYTVCGLLHANVNVCAFTLICPLSDRLCHPRIQIRNCTYGSTVLCDQMGWPNE